jgi:hypothetical protein
MAMQTMPSRKSSGLSDKELAILVIAWFVTLEYSRQLWMAHLRQG